MNGVRTFDGVANGGVRICSVIACTGDTMDTCGLRLPKYTPNAFPIFERLSIEGYLPSPRINQSLQADDVTYYPVSMQPSILPLEAKDYSFDKTSLFGILNIYSYTLLNRNAELYSFGIFGRVFERDLEEPTPPVDSNTTTTPVPEPTNVTDAPGSANIVYYNILLIITALGLFV